MIEGEISPNAVSGCCSAASGKTGRKQNIVLGLVGRGIQGSGSPAMHEREADAQQMRLIYRLYDFDQMGWPDSTLERVLDAARLLGVDGLNVTFPFKQKVMPLLDHIDEGAAMIGAVNTIVFRDGKATGHNTDLYGFTENFRRQLGGEPLHAVVLLGAGGAGAAAAVSMAQQGCSDLRIVDTDGSRAADLARSVSSRFGDIKVSAFDHADEAMPGSNGLINATPIGMHHHPGSPASRDILSAVLWVADIVYVPRDTALLQMAREMGCKTADGAGMAVYQAAAAFDLFTGLTADRQRMLKGFLV
jgi:shikimate dehydrogenase